ncbi:MAG: hypothetical protein Phog2KO_02110 [Phototrophicaceae bacterium]
MSNDMREQVTHYNELVQQYHALDEQIDDLIHAHDGHSENMTDESRQQYRQLARERDDLFSQMRTIERDLFSD